MLSWENTPESLHKQTPDRDALIELYGKMAFKSWLSELLEGGSGVVEAVEKSGDTASTASAASVAL